MPTLSKPVAVEQIAYLAGILDGEGTIGIYRCRQKLGRYPWCYRLIVKVGGTDPELAEWLSTHFEARVNWNKTGYIEHGWKLPFQAAWTTKRARMIVEMVLPYLVIKRKQALVALRFPVDYSQCPEFREGLRQELRVLNRRGYAAAETECGDTLTMSDATVRPLEEMEPRES